MRYNKLLSQHFLTSRAVVKKIMDASELLPTDVVLEIGPGGGILTAELVERGKKVIAVEKDPRLVAALRQKFAGAKNLEIVEGDILKMQSKKQKTQNGNSAFKLPKDYKIVANIPYYITSRFLRLFLEDSSQKPSRMVLMVQKEVAERITAQPPEMNLLALSVQAYGTPHIVLYVSRGNFNPPPEVDSAVLNIADISGDFFRKHKIKPKDFFGTAKKAFSQKRKMLRASLKITGVYATKRPQELSLQDWVFLATHTKRLRI